MQPFRFANKPGITPGKPIIIGETPRLNDLKHIARIESRQKGIKLDCRKLTKASAALVIGYIEQRSPGQLAQIGRSVSIRIGGAY